MFAEKIIRWSGLALAMGGILMTLFWILHPDESVLLTDPAGYQREHILDFIGLMLFIPGLMGLYAHLANRSGWLGLAGFLLTLLPMLVLMGVSMVDMLIWPSIARIQPDLILTTDGEFNQSSGPFAATIALIVPFSIIGAAGFILLGIAIGRSHVLPRWAGLLLAVAGPLYVIGPGFVPHHAPVLNLLVYSPFAVAFLWLGFMMLNRSESEKASLPLPAKQTA